MGTLSQNPETLPSARLGQSTGGKDLLPRTPRLSTTDSRAQGIGELTKLCSADGVSSRTELTKLCSADGVSKRTGKLIVRKKMGIPVLAMSCQGFAGYCKVLDWGRVGYVDKP